MSNKKFSVRPSLKRSLASQIVLSGMVLLSAGSALAVECNKFTAGAVKQVNDSIYPGTWADSDHRYKHGYEYKLRRVGTERVYEQAKDENGNPVFEYDLATGRLTSTPVMVWNYKGYEYDKYDVPRIIDTGSGGAHNRSAEYDPSVGKVFKLNTNLAYRTSAPPAPDFNQEMFRGDYFDTNKLQQRLLDPTYNAFLRFFMGPDAPNGDARYFYNAIQNKVVLNDIIYLTTPGLMGKPRQQVIDEITSITNSFSTWFEERKTDAIINGEFIEARREPAASRINTSDTDCAISVDYSPISHDKGEGKAVADGDTVNLTANGRAFYSGLDTHLEKTVMEGLRDGTFMVTLNENGTTPRDYYGATAIAALQGKTVLLLPNVNKFKVGVIDPSFPGEEIGVEVYNSDEFVERNPFEHVLGEGHTVKELVNYVGDMQYLDMKLAEATNGGTVKANLEGAIGRKNENNSNRAMPTTNELYLAAKNSKLIEAKGSSTVELVGTGTEVQVHFGKTDKANFNQIKRPLSTVSIGGGFKDVSASEAFDGQARQIRNLNDLKNYNNELIRALKAGALNQKAEILAKDPNNVGKSMAQLLEEVYRTQLGYAVDRSKYGNVEVKLNRQVDTGVRRHPNGGNPLDYDEAVTNDGNKDSGVQFVLTAENEGDTAKLGENANLVVSHFKGDSTEAGAMLIAGQGKEATGEIAATAQLAGAGTLVVVKDKGKFTNEGVITAGLVDANGNPLLDRGRQHGYGIRASGENTEITNKGTINVVSTATLDDSNRLKNTTRINGDASEEANGSLTYAIRSDGVKKILNDTGAFINVGVTNAREGRDASAGIWVRPKDAASPAPADGTEVVNLGTIRIGKTQTDSDTIQRDPTYGILVEDKVKLDLEADSVIEIGSKTENAKGIFLKGEPLVKKDPKNTAAYAAAKAAAAQPGTRLNGSVVNLKEGSIIKVHGNNVNRTVNGIQQFSAENYGLMAKNTGDADINVAGTIDVKGLNATGTNAEGNTTIKVHESARIDVDEGTVGARNIGIRASSTYDEAANRTTIDQKGTITLSGHGSIGIYVKDHAHVEQTGEGKVVMNRKDANSREQIGYYLYGERATLNLDRSKPLDVTTDESVMFRIDKGATFDTKGLTIDTSGNDTTAIVVSRKSDRDGQASNVETIGGVYNLNGKGSTFIKVDGGATSNIDWQSRVNILREGVRIGISDGRGYHLTDRPDQGKYGTSGPATDNILNTSLATETHFDGINTYIARSLGVVNFNGSYINLYGKESNAFRMEDGGRLNVAERASFIVNGDAIQAHNANSRNNIDAGRTSLVKLESAEINAINVLNTVSGKLEVDSRGQGLLTGAANTDASGDSKFKLSERSVWNITDNSKLTTLINRGTINFVGKIENLTDKRAYDTLEVSGNYLGVGGSTLSINSNWYEPNDLYSNTVLIKGDAIGRTRVIATNGIGGDVQVPKETDVGLGIEFISENVMRKYDAKSPVITVLGSDNFDNEGAQTFVGEAEILNSALVAQLMKKGRHYYWTLTHTLPAKEVQPEPVVEKPLYVRETAAYLQTQVVNREMGYDLLGKLTDRVSEQQFDCQCIAPQTWSRLSYTDSYNQGKNRFGFGSKRGLVQFGQDLSVNVNETRRVHTGIMAGFSWSNNRFYDKFSSENGVVLYDKETLGSKSQVASLGAYRTAYFANGSYFNLSLNGSWLHNQYQTSRSERPRQDGYSIAASAEVGRAFPISDTWFIQPQVELRGQYQHLEDIQDALRTTEMSNNTSLQGRVGARLTNGTFHLSTNLVHELLTPKAQARMGMTELEERYNPTTVDVSLGGDIALDSERKWQIYGDLKYSRALGKTHAIFTKKAPAESYGGRVGVRYSW